MARPHQQASPTACVAPRVCVCVLAPSHPRVRVCGGCARAPSQTTPRSPVSPPRVVKERGMGAMYGSPTSVTSARMW
eukprot:4987965-Prymnesium_polylepis.1